MYYTNLWCSVIAILSFILLGTAVNDQDFNNDQFVLFNSSTLIQDEGKVNNSVSNVQEKYFSQILDHFNIQDDRTWSQRYYISDEYYKPGGPLFLMISGEWRMDLNSTFSGRLWIEDAKKYQALMVALEHRYYGKSQPMRDLTIENLQYLSSKQALADVANFIGSLKHENMSLGNAKVVVFGRSYPGMLAAWFRLKYPHIAVGAVAHSAPVQAKLNYYGYIATSVKTFSNYYPTCLNDIKSWYKWFADKYDAKDYKTLNKIIQPCTPFDDLVPFNRQSFLEWLMFFGVNPEFGEIKEHCDAFSGQGLFAQRNMINKLAEFFKDIRIRWNVSCIAYDLTQHICKFENISINTQVFGGRMWYYQKCTEFGYFKTTDGVADIFGSFLPLNFYETQYCRRLFGINSTVMEKHVNQTNLWYGGSENFQGTNVLFTNGGQDPWHPLSVLPSHNNTGVISLLVDDAYHCQIANTTYTDPKLMEARAVISSTIGDWLHQQ